MRNKKKSIAFCVCAFVWSVIVGSFNGLVYADVKLDSESPVIKKALLTGVYECYTKGAIKSSTGELGEFDSFGKVIDDDSLRHSGDLEDEIALPSGLTGIKDNTSECSVLFMGGAHGKNDNFDGLFKYYAGGVQYENLKVEEKKTTLLKNMGFKRKQASSTDDNCVYYLYDTPEGSDHEVGYTQNICYNDGDLEVTDGVSLTLCRSNFERIDGSEQDINEGCLAPLKFVVDETDGVCEDDLLCMWMDQNCGMGFATVRDWCEDHDVDEDDLYVEIEYGDYDNWTDLRKEITSKVSTVFNRMPGWGDATKPDNAAEYLGGEFKFQSSKGEAGGVAVNNKDDEYVIEEHRRKNSAFKAAADDAINFLSSGVYSGYGSLNFSSEERLAYYVSALRNWIFQDVGTDDYYLCNVDQAKIQELGDNLQLISYDLTTNNKKNQGGCYVDITFRADGHDYIYGFTSDNHFDASGLTKIQVVQLIEEINKLIGEVKEEDIQEVEVETTNSKNTVVEATCGNSGGAESLGWIVCPILQWMSKAATDVYNGALKPALNVEPKLFAKNDKGEGTDAVHDAWRAFRDIANILFTILFLVVIFSQLTGVGIDNYGIKKILPKLVIAAVLINLSYLICLICVDLSNIVGNGLQDFFEGLPTGNIANSQIKDYIETKSAAGPTLISGLILALLGAGTVFAIWKEPGSLIALLVGALGVVIAIFFVFILLAAREAAIIVLTVLSPLAVVCYMLPNTKKMFDRWMKLWEGLLLIFPICGALIGGGNFVSQLLLCTGMATQGFWSAFIAMIVGALPIFFIPTVLKSAFAAMGAIGARITGFGDRMRSGATRGMRNSNAYQDAQKRSHARNQRISARRRAGIKVDKDGNVVESRRPTARLRRRMAGTWAGRRLGMEAAMGQSAAAFLQQESARRNDIESLNMDAANAQFIKDANAREQRRAEASVGVARVTYDTAMQRARASREAQALKAFQDQYANMSRDQLRAEAGGIASWRGGADGSQRASALISAMESRGMENDIYSMLERDSGIHGDSAVMSTLAGSKNKVLKAFGKTSSTDFASFMSGTGMGSLQGYISGKGKEFLNGIDDKSLEAIATRNADALSTGLLAEAAASLDNADSLTAINEMLKNRNDVTMSGSQLASYGAATIAAIQQSGGQNIDALLKASDDIAADPKLVNKLDTNTRGMINAIRTANGRSGI